MIGGLALAGCASSSKSGANGTSAGAAKERPKVTFTAKDFSFSVPAHVLSGYVDVTLTNQAKQDHQAQLVKLGPATLAQLKVAAVKLDFTKLKPGTVFVGGPNLVAP